MNGVDWKDDDEEEVSLSSPKQIMHSANILKHALIFLKGMLNEHVFMISVSLGKYSKHR